MTTFLVNRALRTVGERADLLPWLRFSHPWAYAAFIALAVTDILLTYAVLAAGGFEINALVAWILTGWGFAGVVVYKVSMIVFVLMIMEIVAQLRPPMGRLLSRTAVALSFIPFIVYAAQVVMAWWPVVMRRELMTLLIY